uniref:Uncharacterized protein n=1 Tax=Globodera rostochiensis TaxID=31243 RepID=A0A914GSM5_GLORO
MPSEWASPLRCGSGTRTWMRPRVGVEVCYGENRDSCCCCCCFLLATYEEMSENMSTLQKIPQVLAVAVRVVEVLSLVESSGLPPVLRRVAVPKFPIRQKQGPKTMC